MCMIIGVHHKLIWRYLCILPLHKTYEKLDSFESHDFEEVVGLQSPKPSL